jgi:hypothetical protein
LPGGGFWGSGAPTTPPTRSSPASTPWRIAWNCWPSSAGTTASGPFRVAWWTGGNWSPAPWRGNLWRRPALAWTWSVQYSSTKGMWTIRGTRTTPGWRRPPGTCISTRTWRSNWSRGPAAMHGPCAGCRLRRKPSTASMPATAYWSERPWSCSAKREQREWARLTGSWSRRSCTSAVIRWAHRSPGPTGAGRCQRADMSAQRLRMATVERTLAMSTTGSGGTVVRPYSVARSMSLGTAESSASATCWSAVR